MMSEWKTPFKEGDNAITFNKAEIGVRWHNWQLGILERYDYLMEFSPQTAELFYLAENHLPLEINKKYELRIKAQHQSSRGLRLGYQKKITSAFTVSVAASYLQGKTLTDGNIQGTAQVTGNKDYNFQFDTDYFYSRDVLFERNVVPPKGNGYSLDFKLNWRPNNLVAAQLDIVDLMGKIFWDDAPHTIATASSATKTYNEDGYVRYDPAISGYESNKNFTQILPRKIFLTTQYQWSANIKLLAEFQDLVVEQFTSIGGGWCLNHNDCFQALYNTTAKALSLRYLGRGLRIELASDQLNINQARYLVFQLSFNQII